MKAFILDNIYDLDTTVSPLKLIDLPIPVPAHGEILIRISCCGVCHTELDEIEGRTPPPHYPVVPGHQVIGVVENSGNKDGKFKRGERVGIAWIFSSCGKCKFCLKGFENLCPHFKGTGRDANGGYAEFMVVNENFAFAIPSSLPDEEAAPLLCAGAIGYRSLKLSNLSNGEVLGLTGFGASGHLVLKMVQHLFPESKVLVFARNTEERDFALSLGANWAGDISDIPPYKCNAIIDTTPVWKSITGSLLQLLPGGRLVINAIRKEDTDKSALLQMSYPDHIWKEKEIKSVANITRKDVEEFLAIAAKTPVKPTTEIYPFTKANEALLDLKHKHVRGAKVLKF